jgi:hypothetical protein
VKLRALTRGQAMVEYSMATHVLFVVGLGMGWFFLSYMMTAWDAYYRSIYYVITAPVP